MSDAKRWEYYVETLGSALRSPKDEELSAMLNELGETGWEVISVENPEGSSKIRVVAKRPVRSSPRKKQGWP